MRISTPYLYEVFSSRIRDTQSRIAEAEERVTTGKRFTRAAQDPTAASGVISSRSLMARFEQLTKNLRAAKDYLGHAEVSLGEMGDLVKEAYSLSIRGASTATTQEAREAMAVQVEQLQRRLIDLGNTQASQGQYIFSGQTSTTKPFSETPPTLTYAGDGLAVNVEVRPAEVMQVSVPGADGLISGVYDAMESLKNNLRSGNIQLLGDESVGELQALVNTVNVARGAVGNKLNTVTSLETHNQRRSDDLRTRISDLQEVDLASAITEYQAAQTAHMAALQVTALSNRFSLMDFIQ